MVIYACNPNTPEAKAEDLKLKASLDYTGDHTYRKI